MNFQGGRDRSGTGWRATVHDGSPRRLCIVTQTMTKCVDSVSFNVSFVCKYYSDSVIVQNTEAEN